MKNDDHAAMDEQLEKHSLPGTNQAGKQAGSCETDARDTEGADSDGPREDQLEKHSLPGTNQAGKGPGSCEEDDSANRELPRGSASPGQDR